MTDRRLIPAAPLTPGELVQTPTGRAAVVRSVAENGEVEVTLAPHGEPAAFRPRWLHRPYDAPCALVFLPSITPEAQVEVGEA
ncbi:MAG: hypothetical protein AB7P31_15205 [Steroidobacteraceae bacterium]